MVRAASLRRRIAWVSMGEGVGSPGWTSPHSVAGVREPLAVEAPRDGRGGAGRDWVGLIEPLLLRGSAAGLFLLLHPYGGLVQDARIYVGRGVADLDPAGVGQDLIFRDDAQTGFSLLRVVVDGLLSLASPPMASLLLALAGTLLWMAACWALLRRLAGLCLGEAAAERAAWAMAVAVAALPGHYGAFGVFSYGEPIATPRVFAEAAALGGLAALLAGRRATAAGLLALAGALHPIMALPAVALAGVVVARGDRRWLVLAAVLAVSVGLAAALGLPLAARLSATMDADWVSALRDRSPYLFPSHWSSGDVASAGLRAATLAIAGLFAPPRARRLLWGAVGVAAGGVCTALLLGDRICDVLVTQLQLWRALWLVAVLGNAGFALSLLLLARRGAVGRIVAAMLVLGWCCESAPLYAALFGVGAVALAVLAQRRPGLRVSPTLVRVATALAALTAAVAVATDGAALHVLLSSAAENGERPSWATVSAIGVQSLPLALAAAYLAGRAEGSPTWSRSALAGSLALLVAAATLWDQRSPDRLGLESGAGARELRAFFAPTEGAVLWVDEVAESWFTLHRPAYFNALQGAPGLFSRDIALTWARRGAALREIGLARGGDLAPWTSTELRGGDIPLKPDAVTRFCADAGRPAGLVIPGEQADAVPSGFPALVWHPPFAIHRLSVEGEKLVWRRTDAFTAVRCP